MNKKVTVTYEYANGDEGVKTFDSYEQAHWWIIMEGDHLIDYTIHIHA